MPHRQPEAEPIAAAIKGATAVRASVLVALLVAAISAALDAQSRFRPAQYVNGPLPTVAQLAVGGGQVLVELTVTREGRVSDVKTLRSTPPFTATLAAAVQAWNFRPAERFVESSTSSRQAAGWQPVDSKVLVAEVVRPPTINTPTLGQPPKDQAAPSDETPFPTNVVTPPYPPLARDSGAVLVEVTVETDGHVAAATVLRSSPAFDASALTAARAWSFQPARVGRVAVSTYAYLIFVFRQPVVTPR